MRGSIMGMSVSDPGPRYFAAILLGMSATDTATDNTYYQNQQKPELTQAELNEQFIDAAWDGQAYRVRRLLEEGADVNCLQWERTLGGDHLERCTALLIAAKCGHRAVVDTLIAGGARVNSDRNTSALYTASALGHTEVVRALLNAGARAGAVTNHGTTCLHVAALFGSEEILGMLLEAGADPNISDGTGRTPLDTAEDGFSAENEAVTRMLKKYGGRNCCHNGH